MAIAIETYEVAELANNVDDCDETRELIKKLNLNGQKSLAIAGGSVFPYRKITKEESDVYSIILPTKTEAKEFSSGSIPLRVLQVMAHADSLAFFDSFEIWHPADVRKDPLLVGNKTPSGRSWDTERYILARWGEVLESFETLKKNAGEMRREILKAQAINAKTVAENALATLDSWPISKCITDNLYFG